MVLITLLAIISFLRKKEPEILLGKYVQRGKWFYLKYLLFICILYIRKVNLHVVWMISPLINIVSLSFQVVGR